jgi:hypothetical protein
LAEENILATTHSWRARCANFHSYWQWPQPSAVGPRQNSPSRRHPPGDGSRQCTVPGGVQYAEPVRFPPALYRGFGPVLPGRAAHPGPEAIKQFWESRIKLGVRDHTFDIIETGADGKYAYQVTKNTVQLVRDTGERILMTGHTVRLFEKQSDGTWKIKIHMFNQPNVP